MAKGTYALILFLDRSAKVPIGKMGSILFNRGYYVYVGSAMSGLSSRVSRHLSSAKKTHWHIDFLLKKAKVVGIEMLTSGRKDECRVSLEIARLAEGSVPQFGSSDCRCSSHLHYFSKNPLGKKGFSEVFTKLL